MRYAIDIDRMVNQLVPHYLGGRKLILYLQSILAPLQTLNSLFATWAREKRIEASMTSQVFKLEWFLNRRLSVYFKDSSDRITIANSVTKGLPLYYQSADIPVSENPALDSQANHTEDGPVLHKASELVDESNYSFIVYSPAISETRISKEEYISQLQYWIDRYRLAGKTYKIKFGT